MIRLLICMYGCVFFSVPADLKKLRDYYRVIDKNESAISGIQTICAESRELPLPLKTAYAAAAQMASGQYKLSPFAKLSAFNAGKKMLEQAVSADSTHIEIRYIRFTIQSNAPSFLGYTKNIPADKAFLLQHLKPLKASDTDLYIMIYSYLFSRGKLSAQEKLLLNKL